MIPTKTIQLDFWRHPTDILHLVQGEADGRKVQFKITDNGSAADLTGFIAIFAIKKPDGNVVVNSATITEAELGIVETTISSQVVTTAGNAHAELHLMNEGQLSKSFRIVTKVAPGVDIDGIAPSVSEFNALQTLIGQAETVISIADTELWPEVVENAQYFSDLAGAGRETETVKANADAIALKEDKLLLTNLVKNGQFANVTEGVPDEWMKGSAVDDLTINGNVMTFTSPVLTYEGWMFTEDSQPTNSKLYIAANVSQKNNGSVYLCGNMFPDIIADNRFLSTMRTSSSGSKAFYIYASPGCKIEVSNPITINLTAAFGAGNEPTVEEMDAILAKFPNSWFDGTVEVSRTLIFKTITNVKLAGNFLTRPNLVNEVDLNNVTTEGRYLGLNTSVHANLPSNFVGKNFLLDVKTYGTSGGFYLQEIVEFNNIGNRMIRFVYPHSSIYGEWQNQGNPKFSNKTIVCFGDSVTEGFAYTPYMQQCLGAKVISVGFGGCRMAKNENTQDGNWYDEMGMYKIANAIALNDFTAMEAAAINLRDNNEDDNTAIVARLKAIDWSTVDYITIFYGQNDFAGDVPLGTDADNDGTTFKGAINYTIDKLLTAYPHLKVAFIAPYFRSRKLYGDGLNSDDNTNLIGAYLVEYVDAIKERAEANHLPVLDLYREGIINKYNANTFLKDGLHPTTLGQEMIGKKISGFLDAKF